MKIPIYQIDAFTSHLFSGNPAAVCPLEQWLDDGAMQSIAAENNLSETAFFVPDGEDYHIRWFTPVSEVDLCGHATLASAYVLFNELNAAKEKVRFMSRSGLLTVYRENGLLSMDFPSQPPRPIDPPPKLLAGIGTKPVHCLKSEDYFLVYDDELDIKNMWPDFNQLSKLDLRGVIVTAPGEEVDFVSRFFAPKFGIDEDPVTGSAHCALTPYWAARLEKDKLTARQLSSRGGELFCENRGDRVYIAGRAVKFLEGFIQAK